jgi:hypothetical protein
MRVTFSFVRRESSVAAAGANDHRGAIGGSRFRKKWSEGWDIFIGVAQGAGGVAGPKWERIISGAGSGRGVGCSLSKNGGDDECHQERPEEDFHSAGNQNFNLLSRQWIYGQKNRRVDEDQRAEVKR